MDKTKEEFFVSKALTNSTAPNIRPELDSTKDPTDTETYMIKRILNYIIY